MKYRRFEWSVAVLEIVLPLLKHLHDGQELLIMDVIVLFDVREGLGEECNRLPGSVLELGQHHALVYAGVTLNSERGIVVW